MHGSAVVIAPSETFPLIKRNHQSLLKTIRLTRGGLIIERWIQLCRRGDG